MKKVIRVNDVVTDGETESERETDERKGNTVTASPDLCAGEKNNVKTGLYFF